MGKIETIGLFIVSNIFRIVILFAILLGTQSFIVSRLISALCSHIMSEAYRQTDDTLKLVLPGIEEGFIVTPNINSIGNEFKRIINIFYVRSI